MEDENDNDIHNSAQLEAMGFTSFGQQPKRPKHRHHGPSGPPESLPRVEIPKEAAPAPLPGDDTNIGNEATGPEQQRHKAPRSYGQGTRARGSNHYDGDVSSGSSSGAYFSRSFTENPWEKLEKKMGIPVGLKN